MVWISFFEKRFIILHGIIDASRLDKPNTTENDNENTYVIKEIARFVPASLFVKVEDMREQKLNQLGIV